MSQSKFNKSGQAIRRVQTDTALGGTTSRIRLNRDKLITEHRIVVKATQTFAGGAPTSVDVRDFVNTIALETSDGRRVYLSGAQVYDYGRFTEQASAVTNSSFTTGVNTSQYAFEIHHENDEALLDLLTALRSWELTTLDLVITWNIDTANGFKGGTSATTCSYATTIESVDYPVAMGMSMQFGLPFGKLKHKTEMQTFAGTTTGNQPDFQLSCGNTTRFLSLHAYDTTGAVPVLSNAIVDTLRLNIAGEDRRVTDMFSVQADNTASRAFTQTGVAFIDLGDDEASWLSLEQVKQANLQWTVKAGAPATYKVVFGQDYTEGKLP
jgi:hypothetical protein